MKKEVNTNSSKLTKAVFGIIKECYPNETLVQEEPIKINGKTLYLDIYIPRLKIAVECDGEQHFRFNKFYHADSSAFIQQKKNDLDKMLFCQESNITLVRVAFNEVLSKELVMDKILFALKDDNVS